MLGKKSSLVELKKYLSEIKQIKNISETQFCQGNTMRWGIAWSHNTCKLPLIEFFRVSRISSFIFPCFYQIITKKFSYNTIE